jgi:hypothetical protein
MARARSTTPLLTLITTLAAAAATTTGTSVAGHTGNVPICTAAAFAAYAATITALAALFDVDTRHAAIGSLHLLAIPAVTVIVASCLTLTYLTAGTEHALAGAARQPAYGTLLVHATRTAFITALRPA